MAARSNGMKDKVAALSATTPPLTAVDNPDIDPQSVSALRQDREQLRRIEAMTYRLAGLTYADVGKRMGISTARAQQLVVSGMRMAENETVEQMRAIENARLDRTQAAIWKNVLDGDEKAIALFLQISKRRAELNGLDAPKQIQLSVSIRQEMEQALGELEQVLGVIDAEVIEE